MTQDKKVPIKRFSIFGLFGSRDVEIPFNSNVNILIGENGLGKTTILNAIYYTLTCKFYRLGSIQFERIRIEFSSGQRVEINKENLSYYMDSEINDRFHSNGVIDYIEQHLSEGEKEALYNHYHYQSEDVKHRKTFQTLVYRISEKSPYAPSMIHRALLSMFESNNRQLEEIKLKIRKEIKSDVLYFPTYRRIEEELHNLGTGKIELNKDDKRLIQFGMEDVQETFNKVILNIKNSALDGFSSITGEMLSQYVDGLNEIDEEIKNRIQPDILKIILERVGKNIDPTYKERIIDLVNSKEIFHKEEQYKYLINFLSNLIKSYDQQKNLDNLIKGFASVCNGYLNAKKVDYNESKVEISVVQKNGQEIGLKNLSSGEKQIISLFAKIFLESENDVIVLFDEPELSLSIEWQRMLLPDVLKSGKCSMLLSVTHSPFIFENELDLLAEDMNRYVRDRIYDENGKTKRE
ncbi:ATP-binding protein [Paenibacillus sp. MER 180]|uniref:AAA family ATPase n=1 Tax=Paenibacillus sp. MER 180 TaxID=2939570 RepID=UPI00203C6A0B|nr:AAA family ATPase [Paenibacillus sp. MER 180]MCM3294088.1 ATP-binding protein [Paenibacillus sp. MER 180]